MYFQIYFRLKQVMTVHLLEATNCFEVATERYHLTSLVPFLK
jgi:hypothetical protein